MPNEIEILNPLDVKGWNDQLEVEEQDSFFYTSNWARVLSGTYHYDPHYLVAREAGKIVGLIPMMGIKSFCTGKRGVSLPFTDYCYPLVNDRASAEQLFQTLIQHGNSHGWKSFELRGELPGINSLPSSRYYSHRLALSPNEEVIFSGFSNNTRRNINKAQREGVEVRIGNDEDSMREFYRLNCMTRKRHGLPPQPYRFFRYIFHDVIADNRGLVLLANKGGGSIAGAVFFHFGKHAIYKFGASDLDQKSLRANSLVMWEAIRWYAGHHFKTFCFGKTELENEGLRRFKIGWGSSERILEYSVYDLKRAAFVAKNSKVVGWHNNVFNKMPIPLARLIGSAIYRHVG
jgi:CelD/BcsL family acetyltransferase involved in cellulose biosynthesis